MNQQFSSGFSRAVFYYKKVSKYLSSDPESNFHAEESLQPLHILPVHLNEDTLPYTDAILNIQFPQKLYPY